jgi:multidrug resistance efflux pump
MPAKRRYNVKGNKDFLVLAFIFFFLCLWAIKDAWYPSPKVVEKHPQEIVVAFETSGLVSTLYVQEGSSVAEEQVLAELGGAKLGEQFDLAKADYTEKKKKLAMLEVAVRNAEQNGASNDGIDELKQNAADAKRLMTAALKEVQGLRQKMDLTELKAPSKGEVVEVLVEVHDQVDAGTPVMKIDPNDHFYLFNKSLAIFSFIAFWVFLGIHVFAQ